MRVLTFLHSFEAGGVERVTGRVDFRGHVPNAAASMRNHDCLLLSFRYEGIPTLVVDALAIVATDCGAGVSSLLEHGRLGRIVPVGSVAEFADALAAARRASRSIEAGRARAEAFIMVGSATRYVDVLRRVAERVVTAVRVGDSNRRERTA
ncbi:glycosyltransferase [Sphingomonas sp.]|uniref:glycosyltransferase n=1 Tax=Sphingomonas sp. TaxID=28214 RepID=UPI002585EF9D|nr:glycosyltransferase [Sphingomonas sp.]